jgi:hypothetical protein
VHVDSNDPTERQLTPPTDVASNSDASRASRDDADEEERRRVGRGGGGMNPANATHSLNIRPDVVDGPAGLEVRTTMKSEDFPARPYTESDLAGAPREEREEPPRERSALEDTTTQSDASRSPVDEFEADLAAAEASAREDDPEREQATQRANEESTKRRNAERAARVGEDVPGEAASSEPDSFVADLRAAAKAAKREREGEGQEAAFRDHDDTNRAVSTGGGRGVFHPN